MAGLEIVVQGNCNFPKRFERKCSALRQDKSVYKASKYGHKISTWEWSGLKSFDGENTNVLCAKY